ncbi:MAG: hypothetical protein CSA38_04645 [Flavobacteriales bacterium]|nr:MAG: hypothetical protein CSA38_04645 [Flavobacteriales bacterium]
MDKIAIHQKLLELLTEKKENLDFLIADVRSSNNDTKSSMGDKYETSREMLQQEVNHLLVQQNRVISQIETLQNTPTTTSHSVQKGSLVETNLGYFYIAIAWGKLTLGKQKIFVISEDSPIAKQMSGLKKESSFTVNTQKQRIKNIW